MELECQNKLVNARYFCINEHLNSFLSVRSKNIQKYSRKVQSYENSKTNKIQFYNEASKPIRIQIVIKFKTGVSRSEDALSKFENNIECLKGFGSINCDASGKLIISFYTLNALNSKNTPLH